MNEKGKSMITQMANDKIGHLMDVFRKLIIYCIRIDMKLTVRRIRCQDLAN